MRLPVTQFPNIDIPIVTIGIAQPGAAPSEIANQIVKPVESAVSDVTGVNHVSATATDGFANITIEFDLEVDTDRALNDIKDAVESTANETKESILSKIKDAEELYEFAKHFPCKINIIEYNPIEDGEFQQASVERVDSFVNYLEKRKLTVNVRRSRGKDIDAACGQLANKNKVN